jgi:membrane fusion protein, multidrug efflux system
MNKIIYLSLAIAGIILLLLYMLGIIGGAKIAPGVTKLPITTLEKTLKTIIVQRKNIDDIFSWPGTVKSRTEVQIAPRITAQILEIKVNAGDAVQKDDVIALLDPEAQRSHQRAAYAALAVAKTDAARASADAQRIKNLYAKEAATKENYDHIMAQYQIAKARVDEAASALKETKVNYADTILKAPFDGIVVKRLKQPGDLGVAGVPLVTMHNSAALRLEAAIPTSCARYIRLGEKVPVRIETLNQDITAEIDEIVPEVDPKTRTILIKAALPVMEELQPGLFGWMEQACSSHNAILVPAIAVRKIGQLEIVKIAVDDQLQTRQVRSGKRYGTNIEIQSGLNEGETVVIQ